MFTGGRAAWGVKFTTHLVLVSTVTMSVAISVLPVYAFVSWSRKISPIFYRIKTVTTHTYYTALNVEWFSVSPVVALVPQ